MSGSNLPTSVDIAHAKLPQVYEAAKQALAQCTRVDECKDWADKAIALASYARQADDDTLVNHARRIQARAVRRCGELLGEFDGRGRPPKKIDPEGNILPPSKRQAAAGAGLSEKQQARAVAVANVPQEEFDAAVDSDSPPTVTELSKQGVHPREVVGDSPPESFSAATDLIGAINRLADFCESNEAKEVARGVKPREVAHLRNRVHSIEQWWSEFSQYISEAAA